MKKPTCYYKGTQQSGSTGLVFVSLLIIVAISLQGLAHSATRELLTVPGQGAQPVTRRVFVRSTSLLVRAAVVEDKLLKRAEFKQLGLVITREESDADLILELRHDLFTKYVFSVVESRTHTIVASGKLSSLGGTVAGKVAKRFVNDIARTSTP